MCKTKPLVDRKRKSLLFGEYDMELCTKLRTKHKTVSQDTVGLTSLLRVIGPRKGKWPLVRFVT